MEQITAIKTDTRTETIVFNAQGDEIARFDGVRNIRPKEYEDNLPIEARIVETTVRILNIIKIEKLCQNN